MKEKYLAIVLTLLTFTGYTQHNNKDSLWIIELQPVSVEDSYHKDQLPDVLGTKIYAGKKTDLLTLNGANANLPQNLGRMIFAKIPGINLWDMDGAGTQMNIGTRGTDAHRSIEMNMRQNGYNTNSDIFGYPENHYTVPMQAVKQVQLVRGASALQFGSQFGGMMNYVMKTGDPDKVFSLESEQTYGSNNLFNSFNAIGGTKGKISYYAFYDDRHGDGWRPNSAFHYKSWYANIKYQFSEKGSLALQFSRMHYGQQIAGGLTDKMFQSNARQSNRSRNYFSPTINIPAAIFKYNFNSRTKLEVTTNGIWGDRSSVQFINVPTVADTFNTNIGSYNPRQVDRDFYLGFTTEARLLHHYSIGQLSSTLSGGVRYFNERTKRRQKGKGTTGSDLTFDLTGNYGIDLKFHTVNYAAFVENLFQISKKFSITPGMRYEVIQSTLSGVIQNASVPVSYSGNRKFPLFGVGIQYALSGNNQLYGNISQAYRPYLYAQITPANQVTQIDPNMKDSKGYNADFGYRGSLFERVHVDVNLFYLYYGNRIGKLNMMDANNNAYLLTTNIGNSVAQGTEMYVDVTALGKANQPFELTIFNSLAYTHARYVSGSMSESGVNVSLKGNHVENVPDWINRSGAEFRYKSFSSTLQMSYTSKKYNDANNTISDPTGVTGVVPSYTLVDWSFKWRFMKNYHVSGGVNNLTNKKYFSRRITMYPGPGILPGVGRTFYVSLGFKL